MSDPCKLIVTLGTALSLVGCDSDTPSTQGELVCPPGVEFCRTTDDAGFPPKRPSDAGLTDDGDAPDVEAADVPYDVRLPLGVTFRLVDAFLLEGPLPAAILRVEMDGASWRLDELRTNTPYVITEEDCSHQGNRDVGRDRIDLVWQNADGTTDEDHLDLRYCKTSGSRVIE